jgi:hypothetical protein
MDHWSLWTEVMGRRLERMDNCGCWLKIAWRSSRLSWQSGAWRRLSAVDSAPTDRLELGTGWTGYDVNGVEDVR